MRTSQDREPAYFGVTLKSGANGHELQGLVDRDIAVLAEQTIDAQTIIYMIENLGGYDLNIDEVDRQCTKMYVFRHTNIVDIAAEKGLNQAEVMQRINHTIDEVIAFLKRLQAEFAQQQQ
jgi:hypothetical protein